MFSGSTLRFIYLWKSSTLNFSYFQWYEAYQIGMRESTLKHLNMYYFKDPGHF